MLLRIVLMNTDLTISYNIKDLASFLRFSFFIFKPYVYIMNFTAYRTARRQKS